MNQKYNFEDNFILAYPQIQLIISLPESLNIKYNSVQREQTISAQIIINPIVHLMEFCKETKIGIELTVHNSIHKTQDKVSKGQNEVF